ncbi:MAG TPA: HepT-like ribonuclease domain-containing protein [Longimicrobium sp.]
MLHDRARVLHMRDATRQALEFAVDRSRADLDTDAMLMLALTRLLEIIGEAAKNVSAPTRALAPGIPWREIAGTRDRIAHGYFDINLDTVWHILTLDLPKLERELDHLIPHLS